MQDMGKEGCCRASIARTRTLAFARTSASFVQGFPNKWWVSIDFFLFFIILFGSKDSFQDAVNVSPKSSHRGATPNMYENAFVSMFMLHQALTTQLILVSRISYLLVLLFSWNLLTKYGIYH